MDDKDVTAATLPPPSRSSRRRSTAGAAMVAVAAIFLGGCDLGKSPQQPYQPGVVNDGGGYGYDDGYPYYDGGYEGGGPGRFNPPPPQGPFSP